MKLLPKLFFSMLLLICTLTVAAGIRAQSQTAVARDPAVDLAANDRSFFVAAAVLTRPDSAESAGFGSSVALQGEMAVVGAPGAGLDHDIQGVVYVFEFDGANWIEKQRLAASDGSLDDRFGHNIALDGDRLLVSAPAGDYDRDGTYVFIRSAGGTWHEQQKLVTSADGHNPGGSIALSGNTALISNPAHTIATIFTEVAGTWIEQQVLDLSDVEGGDLFGESLALSGDTVAISSGTCCIPRTALSDNYVDIFTRSDGKWLRQQTLAHWDATDLAAGPRIALDGNTLFTYYPGVIYTFERDGTAWTRRQTLFTSERPFYAWAGRNMVLDGDTVLIDAGFRVEDGYSRQAGFNLFSRSSSGWNLLQSGLGDTLDAYEGYGRSMSLDGDMVAVGSPDVAANGSSSLGVVNFFERRKLEYARYLPAVVYEWE